MRKSSDLRAPGRPKKTQGGPERPVREEILAKAGELFAKRGFAGVSMREIAKELNLRGPSIYHYFGDKEAILEELVRYSVEVSAAYAAAITHEHAPASVRLHALLFQHAQRLRASPYNLSCVEEILHMETKRFNKWKAQMHNWGESVRSLISEGIEAGEFVDLDIDTAYILIAGLIVALIRPVERQIRVSEQAAGELVASFALRALGAERVASPLAARSAPLKRAATTR